MGHHLVARLANSGRTVRVLARRPERHRANLVYPSVQVVGADMRDSTELVRHFRTVDAVIFLPGILNESGKNTFRDIHVEFPRQVADACMDAHVKRLLHMSALNADTANGASEYLRSRGQGEDIMHLAGARTAVTSFRPSVIFGSDDSFFNRFAGLLRSAPIVPLACAGSRFAPVWVADVANAFVTALETPAVTGKRLELCGPESYTLLELVRYTAQLTGSHSRVVALGDGLSRSMAKVLQFFPGKPLTPDNVRSMAVDSVCHSDGFAMLGIEPAAIETVMPACFSGHSQRGRYQGYRRAARRG